MADSDGFQLVKSRKPKRRPPDRNTGRARFAPSLPCARDDDSPTPESEDRLYELVAQCREDVRRSCFWPRLLATARDAVALLWRTDGDAVAGNGVDKAELCRAEREASLESSDDFNDDARPPAAAFERVVAYGVGSFSSCAIARHQLALLLLLAAATLRRRRVADPGGVDRTPPAVEAYDPVFGELERRVLARFGVEVIGYNEEGKRAVSERTLFFMPHCPKALYNNVLWANWNAGRLARTVIIGNSFAAIELALPSRRLRANFACLAQAAQFVAEYRVDNCFKFPDVFNDLSVHVFPGDRLQLLPACISDPGDEPVYDDEDELITADRS